MDDEQTTDAAPLEATGTIAIRQGPCEVCFSYASGELILIWDDTDDPQKK